MSSLDRYRKKGGFVQLLTVLEGSNKQKQEQFLGLIAQESPAWERALRQKMLSGERILTWAPETLAEIIGTIPHLTTAVILSGMPKAEFDRILKCVPSHEIRRIKIIMDEKNPTAAEKFSCMLRLVQEVRSLLQRNFIKADKVDPELHIPSEYEEELNQVFTPVVEGSESYGLVIANKSDVPAARPTGGDEVEFLRRKINALNNENLGLKAEIHQLKSRLEQIRRIA